MNGKSSTKHKTKFNLRGKRFGKLVVKARCYDEIICKKKNDVCWLCQCDCGNKCVETSSSLRHKLIKSCKCFKGTRKEPFWWLYSKLVRNANNHKRKYLFFEQFLTFTKITCCHYCNTAITWNKHASSKRIKSGYNIDRKDNSQGYEFENCIVCCSRCNAGKGDRFTYAEWFAMTTIFRSS